MRKRLSLVAKSVFLGSCIIGLPCTADELVEYDMVDFKIHLNCEDRVATIASMELTLDSGISRPIANHYLAPQIPDNCEPTNTRRFLNTLIPRNVPKRYEVGHLVPVASIGDDPKSIRRTLFMVNTFPIAADQNQSGAWSKVERLIACLKS